MSTTLLNGLLLLLAATSLLHLVDSSDNSGDDSGTDFDPSEYPVCGEKYQSPVDIKVQSTVFNPDYAGLKFEHYDDLEPDFKITNKGKTGGGCRDTVEVKLVSDAKSIGIYDGGLSNTYYLAQFHFHWGDKNTIGSPHKIDGHAYPMEIHVVHYNGDYESTRAAGNMTGGLAVLCVFVEIGNENNTAFSKIISQFGQIPNEGDNVTITDTFPMDSLLPNNREDYYRYNGSAMSPPCYQSVNWTVFKEPIAISAYQIEEFRNLYETAPNKRNNFRPTKPLHGRIIYRTYEESETSTTSPISTTAGAGILSCSTFILLYSTIFIFVAAIIAI